MVRLLTAVALLAAAATMMLLAWRAAAEGSLGEAAALLALGLIFVFGASYTWHDPT